MVVVEGSEDNFKITTPNDWNLAEIILEGKND
jgi:2-C-methyl-D-erythritol 4-phosphate cytidylyltransferase